MVQGTCVILKSVPRIIKITILDVSFSPPVPAAVLHPVHALAPPQAPSSSPPRWGGCCLSFASSLTISYHFSKSPPTPSHCLPLPALPIGAVHLLACLYMIWMAFWGYGVLGFSEYQPFSFTTLPFPPRSSCWFSSASSPEIDGPLPKRRVLGHGRNYVSGPTSPSSPAVLDSCLPCLLLPADHSWSLPPPLFKRWPFGSPYPEAPALLRPALQKVMCLPDVERCGDDAPTPPLLCQTARVRTVPPSRPRRPCRRASQPHLLLHCPQKQ